MKKITVLFVALHIFVSACGKSAPSTDVGSSGSPEVGAVQAPPPRILPTLYPSATSRPIPKPTDTRPPVPTDPPDTPVTYDQLVVELVYAIPAIGLERSVVGDVSGRLKLTDSSAGVSVERRNQAGILIEMQQSLPALTLDQLPDGCDGCVWIEYNLPLTGDQDQGWLQDVRILASIENFTSALLGPHFPPDTVIGLRRSATQNQVAHSVALTSDGRLFRWTATDSKVSESETLDESDPILSVDLGTTALQEMSTAYAADCPGGAGIETLFFKSVDLDKYIQIVCPEIALPSILLPIYLGLDAKAAGLFAEGEGDVVEPSIDQETVLLYRNADGVRLKIYYDGRTFLEKASGDLITDTITTTMAISLSQALLEANVVHSGLEEFLSETSENVLVIRGPDGLYELGWDDDVDPKIEPVIMRLERLIDRILSSLGDSIQSESTPENPAEQTETPTPQPTVTPS
jgi:hypothetical protein